MDEEQLKVLKRIEALLRQSSSIGSAGKIGGGKNDEDEQMQKTLKTFKATAVAAESLGDNITALSTSFNGLNKEVRISRATFYSLNKTMKSAVSQPTVQNVQASPANFPVRVSDGGYQEPQEPPRVGGLLSHFSEWAARLQENSKSITSSNIALAVFGVALRGTIGPMKQVINDMLNLQARGISASDSLAGLYVDAVFAGMSLQDYTNTVLAADALLARSSSLDDFNKKLSVGTDALARYGVFGESATKLSATMAESATELGIPQGQLADSTKGLIGIFGPLQQSMRMTADGFDQIVKSLSDNEEVQQMMLGLAPLERAARMNDLVQMQTFGKSIGASAAASKALADAFMAQRSTMFEQRFEAKGRLQQLGAFLGMNTAATQQAGNLALKKNLTSQDQASQTAFFGQMAKELNQRLNSGNDAIVYAAEQQMAALPEFAKQQLAKSGVVQLQSESGKAIALQVKASNALLEGAGHLATVAEGFSKSPIGEMVSTAFGAALGQIFTSRIGSIFGKLFGGSRGVAGVQAATAGAKAFSVADKAGGLFKSMGQMFTNLISPVTKFLGNFKSIGGALSSIGDVFVSAFQGAKFLTKISGFVSLLIDPITEMFTGTMSAAFSPDSGIWSRLGNAVFAGFTGMITGITGLIDSVFNTNMTNFFEKGFTLVRVLGQRLLKGSIDGIIGLLPSTLVPDWMKSMSSGLESAIDNSDAVLQQLSDDSSKTLASIGEQNKKANETKVVDAKKANDTVSALNTKMNNVVYGPEGLTANVLETARAMKGSAIIATPGQSPVTKVTQPDVNKSTEQTPQTVNAEQVKQQPAVAQPDMQALITQLISLMQQSLAAESAQVDQLGQLVRLNSKTTFGTNDDAVNRVYKFS